MGSSKRRSVPDFIRRGLRQGLGVAALVAAGYEVVEPFEGAASKTASQWLTCFKWAAITLIVLTAPVLGKVAQVSSERVIGTLAGGALGLITVLLGREMMQITDQAFTAIISGFVAFGAVCLGHYLKLEYAGKLLAMTFILVIIGADERVDAFIVALTRCSGIILGVLISVILAVLVFPKSASHQATDNLSEALQAVCAFSQLAWQTCQKQEAFVSPESGREDGAFIDTPSHGYVDGAYIRLGSESATPRNWARSVSAEENELVCEKLLMDIYSKLSAADDLLPLAKREQYMFTFRGRWCFLPAIPFHSSKRWTIPAKQMQELATAVRKVSRVLWALHVTFKEGLDDEILNVLSQRFPPDTMVHLESSSQQALRDMAEAFPDDTILPSTNFHNFCTAVDDLIQISNDQRNALLKFVASGPACNLRSSTDKRASFDKQSRGQSDLPEIRNNALQELQAYAGFPATSSAQNVEDIWGTTSPSNSADAIVFNDVNDECSTPHLSVEKIDGFSLTSDGYLSKVRWLSFQFLMQHLANEMRGMHKSLAVVLKMMPNALQSREGKLWNL